MLVRSSNFTMEVSSASVGDAHIEGLVSLTKGILALDVILTLILLAILVLLFPLLRKKQATQHDDSERGIELQDRPSNPPQNPPQNPAPQVQEPEYPEPSWGGHANEYYADCLAQQDGWKAQPLVGAPSSRHHMTSDLNKQSRSREQQTRPSGGRGYQTYGADYSKGGRESRFNTDANQSNNSNSQVNYGRKGNRFAHGT